MCIYCGIDDILEPFECSCVRTFSHEYIHQLASAYDVL